MSKYTKAEEHFICFLTECSMWCRENHLTDDFRTAIEALQMANRLKQAHWTRSDGISDILYDLDCTAGVSHSDIFVQGYEKALADIRGDNNG